MPGSRGKFLIITLIILLSASCGKKQFDQTADSEQLYQDATEELKEDKGGFPWIFTGTDYKLIFNTLKEIQLRDPYSPYATLAELRTADTYFKKEEYEQAAIEYEEFLKRHPGHEESSYATYRLALTHYKLMRGPDRDPTNTREALKWFQYFIENYPDSPLATEAYEKMSECRNRLAKREIYIGKFYAKRKNYKAAAHRYNVVVNEYSDTNAFKKALYLLGDSYFKMGDSALAKQTLIRVINEFPDTDYQRKAESLLQEVESNESEEVKEG